MKYTYNSSEIFSQAKMLMEDINKKEVFVENTNFRLIKRANNGKLYAIVAEGQKFALKSAIESDNTSYQDFKYVTGEYARHKSIFETYISATKGLATLLKNTNTPCANIHLTESDISISSKPNTEEVVNEVNNDIKIIEDDEDIANSMISEYHTIDTFLGNSPSNNLINTIDTILSEGEKFTMKLPAPKDNDEESFDDVPAEEGDEESFDDIPAEEGGDSGDSKENEIQRLAGSLATAMREFNKENGPDSEVTKYAVNSLLSAIDVSNMAEEDIQDMHKKLDENPSNEEGDEESFEDIPADEEFEEPIDEELNITTADWDEKNDMVMSAIDRMKTKDFNKTPKKFTGDESKYPSREEVRARYKDTDPSRPLGENFNKNIEEYLVKQINPRIFAKEENNDMTKTAPAVKPTETKPAVNPDRRSKPFQSPSVKPQPKFKG